MRSDSSERPVAVSIIMPCYNVAAFVGETLDSLFAQTLQDFELICLDDGSTDSTVNVLRGYAAQHANMTVVQNENHRQGWERNRGLQMATGRYVYYMDADDILLPEALAVLVGRMDRDDLDLVYFEAEAFCESEDLLTRFPKLETRYRRLESFPGVHAGEDLYFAFCKKGGLIVSPCLQMARRDWLVASGVRFPELPVMEDNLYTVDALFAARRVAVLKNVLYRRRVRSGSTMTSLRPPERIQATVHTVGCLLERMSGYGRGKSPQVLLGEHALKLLRLCLRALMKTPGYEDDLWQMFDERIQAHELFDLLVSLQRQSKHRQKALLTAKEKVVSLRQKVVDLEQENRKIKSKLRCLQKSRSYRLARILTWPLRCVKAVISPKELRKS